jgi:hypothetical protein
LKILPRKNFNLSLLAAFLLCRFLFSGTHVVQQQTQQEKVTVIAVEVPVRILHKGQVVRGMTKDDFEIYEDGIKQEITDFERSIPEKSPSLRISTKNNFR